MELPPFRAAIRSGVDAIMTAHIAVPALAPADVPATLSPAILTGLLRGEMGFKGIVVTDALEMGGIAQGFSSGEAAVLALEAGADALVMPPDPEAAVKAILAAIQSGRLTRARIEESLTRLLAAKERVGLDRRSAVDLDAISDDIAVPEDQARAQEIASRAVTLVKNDGDLIPLRAPAKTCFLTLAESHYSNSGLEFAQEVRRREGRHGARAGRLAAGGGAGCRGGQNRGMRDRGGGCVRCGGGIPRRCGAGRRFPTPAGGAIRERQARGAGRSG